MSPFLLPRAPFVLPTRPYPLSLPFDRLSLKQWGKNGVFLLVTLRSLSNLPIMFIAPLVYVFHVSVVCFNVLLKLSMRDNVLRFVQILSIIFS